MQKTDQVAIPVSILTGFLGSGKTTLLASALRSPEMTGTAVIINEFGEVGLDDVFLRATDSRPVMLANGCLCCKLRGELAPALQDLFADRAQNRLDFRRVIIETTGLADPAPLLHTLMSDPAIARFFRLDGLLATIDCVHGMATIKDHPVALKQVAMADRLLMTKCDLAEAHQVAELRRLLLGLNPGAAIIESIHGQVDTGDLVDVGLYNARSRSLQVDRWLRAEAFEAGHGPHCNNDSCDHPAHQNHRHTGIGAVCLVSEAPVAWKAFSIWMEQINHRYGAGLLRVKGIINVSDCPGEPLVIHGVQQMFHPPVRMDAWPGSDHRTKIVLIGHGLESQHLQREFARMT